MSLTPWAWWATRPRRSLGAILPKHKPVYLDVCRVSSMPISLHSCTSESCMCQMLAHCCAACARRPVQVEFFPRLLPRQGMMLLFVSGSSGQGPGSDAEAGPSRWASEDEPQTLENFSLPSPVSSVPRHGCMHDAGKGPQNGSLPRQLLGSCCCTYAPSGMIYNQCNSHHTALQG